MTDTSPRLGLPLLAAGQAQKEITHNEALTVLDGLVHLSLEARTLAAPPAAPQTGQCWLIPAAATGVWAGRAQQIGQWTSGGWRYSASVAGMIAWSKADGVFGWCDGTAWQWGSWPVGGLRLAGQPMLVPARPAIPAVTGGTVVDIQARDGLLAILQALRAHGLIQS